MKKNIHVSVILGTLACLLLIAPAGKVFAFAYSDGGVSLSWSFYDINLTFGSPTVTILTQTYGSTSNAYGYRETNSNFIIVGTETFKGQTGTGWNAGYGLGWAEAEITIKIPFTAQEAGTLVIELNSGAGFLLNSDPGGGLEWPDPFPPPNADYEWARMIQYQWASLSSSDENTSDSFYWRDMVAGNSYYNFNGDGEIGMGPLLLLPFDQGEQGEFKAGIFSRSDAYSPIPEPATMLSFGTGLLGLFGFLRKRFFKK